MHLQPIIDALASPRVASYENTVKWLDRKRAIKKVVGKFIRLHWTDDAVFLEELPVRGKKRLGTLHCEYSYLAKVQSLSHFITQNLVRDARVQEGDSYRAAVKKIKDAFEKAITDAAIDSDMDETELRRSIRFDEEEVWYLKVAPGSSDPITAEAADFTISSSWTDFSAFSPDSDLQNHDPSYTKYVSKSAGAARKLYKILNADPDALAHISWSNFGKWLDQNKISYDTRFSTFR